MKIYEIIACLNSIFIANNNKTRLVTEATVEGKVPTYVCSAMEVINTMSFDSGTRERVKTINLTIVGHNPTPLELDTEFQGALDLIENVGINYENRLDQMNGAWTALGYSSNIKFLSVEVMSRSTNFESDTLAGIVTPHVTQALIKFVYSVTW